MFWRLHNPTRILSRWSEWAFITPRLLKNKLELPFDDQEDVDDYVYCVIFGKVHVDDGDFDESSMMMLMITYIV